MSVPLEGGVSSDGSQRAWYDPLTGLANWQLFVERAAEALARASRNSWAVALVVIDLDRFHAVNDVYGFEVGDAVLADLAHRLVGGFRPSDALARPGSAVGRLGGDEFVVLCERVPVTAAARILRERVGLLLDPPFKVGDNDVKVTAGVGVAFAQPDDASAEDLIVRAEAAMRRAKRNPGSRSMSSPEALDAEAELDVAGKALERALAHGELVLHYQPKVALDSDRIVGAEALLRWEDPRRGLVPPLEFIPLAEETGLIVPIGAWVIEEACRQAERWRRSFPERPVLVVSVNVSARQFGPGLVDVVAAALSSSGTDPAALCVELTESLLMDDVEGSVAVLEELAGLGVALSIDDFGTGYSSLAYLKRFPLHELKIDKSFVDGLGRDADDTAIVAAVVATAHALGLYVVAEGVETAEQLQRLRILGCEQAQGYHFARPGPPDAIDEMLHEETTGRPAAASSHSYRPERILVVDDAADVRQLAHMSLSAVGFDVVEAIDGASAITAATLLGPDCVLLDLVMPDMSGLEVCRALRGDRRTAGCTILMLTSNDQAADKVEAFASGADDYIVKPFSPRDLASRVNAAMGRRRRARAATVVIADEVEVDLRPRALPVDETGSDRGLTRGASC